jgi:3-methyladenine DNA glycosylase AlkD
MIDDPRAVSEAQMERWVADFDAWDICDCCCGYLLDRTPVAYEKAVEWSGREEEYVKRAGFALMAYLAVHDKKAPDEKFLAFLPVIVRESDDERNFVKKAINWALRQIGKRNLSLNAAAIGSAREIQKRGTKAARWIAADALRELTGDAVQERLRRKVV